MSYRAEIKSIFSAHKNAWVALFGRNFVTNMSKEEIVEKYEQRYHAKLIQAYDGKYDFIKFRSKKDYVLFMLEWR